MSSLLVIAIVAIVSALVFYTIGVWSERFAGRLKAWHLILFWIGFVFDTTGTTTMGNIAGRFDLDIHGITGLLAIVLMLCHAIWATVVLVTKQENAIRNFHKFSLFVWLVWLIPFFTGMIGAMVR
ncbi:MAG: HsmA family protein [Anaerolineaceae bacterium]|jgi:uncharacterized repeat protein (TIGR03987 family)